MRDGKRSSVQSACWLCKGRIYLALYDKFAKHSRALWDIRTEIVPERVDRVDMQSICPVCYTTLISLYGRTASRTISPRIRRWLLKVTGDNSSNESFQYCDTLLATRTRYVRTDVGRSLLDFVKLDPKMDGNYKAYCAN